RWLQVASVATILSHHAGTAQMMLAAYAGVWCIKNLRPRYIFISATCIISAFLGFVLLHQEGHTLGDVGGRLDRWFGRFQNFWLYGGDPGLDWWNIVLGVGPGTFMNTSML